jgi:hypothetical protein
MIRTRYTVVLALLAGACAFGQDGQRMRMRPPGGPGGGDFAFVGAEFGFPGKVVKGAPYSAQAVTQFTQTLADGNHVQKTSTSAVARDSEGRTRTEHSMGAIGQMTASGTAAKAVFIHDPVAGMSYALDPNSHTARQMAIRSHNQNPGSSTGSGRGGSRPGSPGDSTAVGPRRPELAARKTEDLGTQVMDGIAVQGKRITHTIPAARAGSDRDIDVVTESWYSQDLQAVVMSKTSDPRSGESVYKLTNINRAEPDHALFTVPSDYTVQQQQGRPGRSAN